MSESKQSPAQPAEPKIDWKRMLATGPYPREAFDFVREGLNHTVEHVHPPADNQESRHISGQQLCLGLRDFAIHQYGLMAPVVLNRWHVHRTDDFGRIVFAMIKEGVMSKTAEDRLDDFRGVYDFDEAFADSALLPRLGQR